MTIEQMHYDFKVKINRIDTTRNRDFYIPEIDWMLNEAQELFVKMVAFPRRYTGLGFEVNQRTTDDIKPLVVFRYVLIPNSDNEVVLPEDYWHYLRGEVIMSKGKCNEVEGRIYVRQHDDEFEKSPFDKSSFEWREVNATFYDNRMKLYNRDFTVDRVLLTYLRRPVYMHFAQGFGSGSYTLPDGTILTGKQDCELPEHTHREIVDIAVMLATRNINIRIRKPFYNKNIKGNEQ